MSDRIDRPLYGMAPSPDLDLMQQKESRVAVRCRGGDKLCLEINKLLTSECATVDITIENPAPKVKKGWFFEHRRLGKTMGGKFKGMPEASTPVERSKDHMVQGPTDNDSNGSLPLTNSAGAQFDVELRDALDAEKIADARTLVANAEAVMLAHTASDTLPSDGVSSAHVAAAKAHIAIATGDGPAARAILVQAIERNPKVAALRTLMSEVMLADGRASDVRPVLQHLGKTRRDLFQQIHGTKTASHEGSS